jgi:DNA-binding LacI/PurR family transcriptional regulator
MKRRTTRSDVAKRAGVSTTTVTFVLGNRNDIAIPETTRNRVRQAARDLDYQPSAIAKALVSGKTNAICVAFPNLFVPHYSRVLRSIESLTKTNGFHLIAITIGQVGIQSPPDLHSLLNSPSDAVILVDLHDLLRPMFANQARFSKPVVAMGIYNVQNVDCIEVDLRTGAAQALAHLLCANPKRLAFFGFGSEEEANGVMKSAAVGSGDPRAVAYYLAMTGAGRPLEVIHGSHMGRRTNVELLQEYVRAHGCPDAIFCYDDELAISAHYGLRKLGIRLPEDVLLVGCDGNEECEYLDPSVTTITQPVDEMCRLAWSLLQRRMDDADLPVQTETLSARLVVRESSTRNASDNISRKLENKSSSIITEGDR